MPPSTIQTKFYYCFFCYLLITTSLHCQKTDIHYYTTDSSSYIVPDLYAQWNRRKYKLFDKNDPGCFSIEAQKDFNGDGKMDILMGDIIGCGGNCCGNAYFFFSFQNGQFVRTKSVGNGEYLESEFFENSWSILIQSYILDSLGVNRWVKERYVLRADSIVQTATYYSEKIKDGESAYDKGWDSSYYQLDKYFTYTVQKEGQSLWGLAIEHKTTIQAIKTLNNLEMDVVYVGNNLKIPAPDTTKFHLHTLATGESLWKISQQYKVPIDVIKKANGLLTDTVKLGETLKIPKRL